MKNKKTTSKKTTSKKTSSKKTSSKKSTSKKNMKDVIPVPFTKLSEEELELRTNGIENLTDEEKHLIETNDNITKKQGELFNDIMDIIIPNSKKTKVPVSVTSKFIPKDLLDGGYSLSVSDFFPSKVNKGDYITISKNEWTTPKSLLDKLNNGYITQESFNNFVDENQKKNGIRIQYISMQDEKDSQFLNRIFKDIREKINKNKNLVIGALSEEEEKSLYAKLKEKYSSKKRKSEN